MLAVDSNTRHRHTRLLVTYLSMSGGTFSLNQIISIPPLTLHLDLILCTQSQYTLNLDSEKYTLWALGTEGERGLGPALAGMSH